MKPRHVKLTLTEDQYEHIIVTLEGCRDELEELSAQVEWYCTALPERIDQCLVLLEREE